MRQAKRLSIAGVAGQRRDALATVPPPLLVLLAVFSVQFGGAIAKHLFPLLGPAGTVLLRIGFAAVILNCIWRPRLDRAPRAAYAVAVLFGLALAAMNFTFYQALDRIPLGMAVTIEFAGPLGVALLGTRHRRDLVWVGCAVLGLLLLAPWTGSALDPLGILLALGAGACWALYIVLGARLGKVFASGSGVALAMMIATVAVLPIGIWSAGTALLNPLALGLGLGVAILSSAIPYTLEIEALRRLPMHVYGILTSMEPAVAALAGLILLGEYLHFREVVALVLVTLASIGATFGNRQVPERIEA